MTNQTKVQPAKKNSWTRPAPLSGKRSISNCFEVILRYIQNDLRVFEPSLEKNLSLGACRNPSGKIIILVLVGTLVNLHGIQCLAMSQYILAHLFSHYAGYIRIVCNKQAIQKDATLQKKHRHLKLTCLEASERLGGGNSTISYIYPYILGETIQFHSYFLRWIGSTTN